jgi:hypothetical protein
MVKEHGEVDSADPEILAGFLERHLSQDSENIGASDAMRSLPQQK